MSVFGFKKTGGFSRADLIENELKRLTAKSSIKLKFNECGDDNLLASKLGGTPYIGKNDIYPVDNDSKPMIFLLQLNIEDINFDTPLLKKGLLQFFVEQSGKCVCCVRYIANIDCKSCNLMAKDSLPFKFASHFSPVLKKASISFEKNFDDFMCVNDKSFDSYFKTAVKNISGKEINDDMNAFLSPLECEKFCSVFTGKGSKLFGNPCFLQDDFRDDKSDDLLLLQLDSDNDFVNFGDGGTANFFVEKDDFEKADFSNVTYNWDCY